MPVSQYRENPRALGAVPLSVNQQSGSGKLSRWAVMLLVTSAVGCYYLWAVRASGPGFEWGRDLGGFYNYLARAFVNKHLYLPFAPAPQLLALPNPWDPAVGNDYKVFDLALYNRRYYVYHGAAPALLLFAPWRLLTKHDLPENFAVFLLAFGGFLFSCATLLRILSLAGAKLGPIVLAVLLVALGGCQGVPFLFSRIFVYEVAIAGGYFFLSGALFFFVTAIPSVNQFALAASGLFFGLAVGCRPNLVFAAGIGAAALAIYLTGSHQTRRIIAFFLPLCAAGAAIAAYNYLRFGNPFEFGMNYLLGGGNNQNRIKLSTDFLLPGIYFFLWCAPDFSLVFPWMRLAFRHPFGSPAHSFPPGYFIEPTAGVLWLAPFVAAALFIPRRDGLKRAHPAEFFAARIVLWTVLAIGVALLFSITWTGFTTQRYELDFLPSLVLVALANIAIYIDQNVGWKRSVLSGTLAVLVGFSAVANLALGISGPHEEMLQNHPQRYLRLADWLSPFAENRPLLNPEVAVAFTAQFAAQPDGLREPLLTLGATDGHFIYAEHQAGTLRIVSRSGSSTLMHELKSLDNQQVRVAVTYSPASRTLVTKVNDQEILVQPVAMLLTAPSEITIGENRIDPNLTSTRFTGRISDAHTSIHPRQN